MPHADDARLHAYLDGELGWLDDNPALLQRHLEECAECRTRLEEAKRLREQGRLLLGGYLPVERPPFDAVLRRARGASERSGVRRRVPAGMWAASLVLALAGGWLAHGILGGGSAPGGDPVQFSSAPAPAPPATAIERDSGESPLQPTASVAAPTRLSEPIVEAVVSRSAAAAPAVQVPPAVQRAEPEPLAVQAPLVTQGGESEPLAVQIPPGGEEAGRIGLIEGRVTDESGRVIHGAAVQLRGLGVGTLTGPDGTYSLTVPEERMGSSDGLEIMASHLGWESSTQPLPPGAERAVTRDFRLRPAQVALEGVVAVGVSAALRPRYSESGEQTGAGWAPAALEEVRRLLGRDAFMIAEVTVLETSIGWVDGIRTVRVRQELPGGVVCTLLQWAERIPPGSASAAAALPGRSPSRGSAAATEAEATAWRNGVRIVARAPLAADSLAALLERLE